MIVILTEKWHKKVTKITLFLREKLNLRHRFNNLRHRFNNFRQFCSLCMTEQPGISAVLVLYSCLVR